MSQESSELYAERVEAQQAANEQLFKLQQQALTDKKKYLPFGPIFFNLSSEEKISLHLGALNKLTEQSRKKFCNNRCEQRDNCLAPCEQFYSFGINYGLKYFKNVYKYGYSAIEQQDQ